MQHTSRVSPCYPYRYKEEGESDAEYSQRLGDDLEQEILRVGKGKVAAFFAETGQSNLIHHICTKSVQLEALRRATSHLFPDTSKRFVEYVTSTVSCLC